MFRAHGIASEVEIAEVLGANDVLVEARDARGVHFEANHPVRENGEVLRDVGPTVDSLVDVVHPFLHFEVVIALEMGVVGDVGLGFLHIKNRSSYLLLR